MRNSSIELLRISSIFLIIMMHVASLVTFDDASNENKAWIGAVNAIGNCGVSCFILISGYYGVRYSKRKLLYLLIVTTIYSLIVSLLNDGMDLKSLLKAVLCIPLYSHWFIVCYLALILLSPYVNAMAEMLTKKDFARMLLILCILLSVIPTVFISPSGNGVFLSQGGKCFSYFIFVYFIGRYIRLHADVVFGGKDRKRLVGGEILMFAITLVFILVGSYFTHQRFFVYSCDCSVLILAQSVLLFYLAKSYVFYDNIVNRVATSVFAMYVLNYAYTYVDREYVRVCEMANQWYYILAVAGESLLLMVAAFLIDQVIGRTIKNCLKCVRD